ncbi:MAG: hypothetical protein HFI72_01615 [Peptococcaceae bacterium]|jgi:hypothetical protein|nr:hypothetical protein [Peptococcaceae bacterium]
MHTMLAHMKLSDTTKKGIDQLYKRLYAPFEKNLWIFFNLGYDCCQA